MVFFLSELNFQRASKSLFYKVSSDFCKLKNLDF